MGGGVGKFKDLLSTPLGSHIYYIHNIGEQPPPSPFLTFYVMNIVIIYYSVVHCTIVTWTKVLISLWQICDIWQLIVVASGQSKCVNQKLCPELTGNGMACSSAADVCKKISILYINLIFVTLCFYKQERSNRHLFSRHDNRHAHSDMGDLETYFGMVSAGCSCSC